MALAFPLTAANFWGGLEIASMRLWTREPMSVTRLGDGSILRASLGAELWQGEIELVTKYHEDQAAVDAIVSVAARAGASFLAYDTRLNGPREDPGGAILGSSTVTIASLNANNREMGLAGLPAGYVLSRGDQLGWQYGTPSRYALHRVVTGGTANGSGEMFSVEVTPPIRGGAAEDDEVTLVRPVIKAVLTDPQYGASRPVFSGGATFSFIQTLSS